MPETQGSNRECPHSVGVSTSVKGVITVDVKQYYADPEEGLQALYRLRAILEEAARVFPTFCLNEDLTPKG
ncbi:MAG TPA: hypothetical protein VGM37_03510 [Armatimonadota bacterium]|jgi:hypothetical protein